MNEKKILTLFEDRYSTVPLTSEQRSELLSLEKIWGSQNFILRSDNRLLLKRYVGFVATPNLQIQILPKIYQESSIATEQSVEKEQAVMMLFRLLHFSGFMTVKELPTPHQLSMFQHDLLEIFIQLFLKKFHLLFQHQIHRQYEDKEENTIFIKGKILFQKTILNNGGFKDKHYIHYQEFTEDTLLNQIFKTIMLLLRNITKNADNKKQLTIALVYLEDVQMVRLSSLMFEKVRFNRLNELYRPLFEMARMFYHNHQPGFSSGDQRTFTFLVPLNQLFEFTLYKLLQEEYGRLDWEVNYQLPQKFLDESQSKFLLKPDITVSYGNGIKMIVDAKYKNPVLDSSVNVSQSDVYQMLAYAIRYECDNLFLVYPKFKDYTSLQNPLATYEFNVQYRKIHLSVLNIDITESDINLLRTELMEGINFVMSLKKLT